MAALRVANLIIPLLAGVLGSPAVAGDIGVKVIHFGAGDIARAAGPLAVQVEFRSALDGPVEIEAVWELPNADLDVAEYSRTFVLNPGQAQRRWLYGVLPPYGEGRLRDEVFDLRLYEVKNGERVRDLGTAKIAGSNAETPPVFLQPTDDAFAVVGPRSCGLDIYNQASSNGNIPSMNTMTVIGNFRDAESFPDRWEGYAAFDVVVWGGGSIPPSRISEDSANALTEWMTRGGNFVIALPAAGDPWSIGTADRHAFSALLPKETPVRIDDVRIADLLPMLSVSNSLRAPDSRTRLTVFDPATLTDGWRAFVGVPAPKNSDGVPELASANTIEGSAPNIDGLIIGVRREVGFGHMTVIGLDVEEIAARGLQTPAIPQGDVFWNRILSRRADTPSGAEYIALDDAGRLASGGYARTLGGGAEIAPAIGLAGEAAVGVLAATAVFALYWLIAGPLGFALLKSWKKERWSWVAYVAVAAVFTVGIWAIGGSLAGSEARIRHLTVLDMIERAPGETDVTRPQLKRATGWFSLFAPQYGSTRVTLDTTPAAGSSDTRNQLSSWRSVESIAEGFPSSERYLMALDSPNTMNAPSRATSIDFEVHWLGGVKDGWGRMPSATKPVSVEIDRSKGPARITINGTLTHSLPAPLTGVMLLHVWPMRNPLQALRPAVSGKIADRRYIDQLPNRGSLVSAPNWAPGSELDLTNCFPEALLTDRLGLENALRGRFSDPIYQTASQYVGGFGIADAIPLERVFEMLTFYNMLEPPAYLKNPPSDPKLLRITRASARTLDLSAAFTEPCLVIMGWLADVELPYPLTVDGEEVPAQGSVFVRWVLPLPADYSWVIPDKIPRTTSASEADTTAVETPVKTPASAGIAPYTPPTKNNEVAPLPSPLDSK